MNKALVHARAAMEWLNLSLWNQLRGIPSYTESSFANEAACRMLEAQAKQAARLGLRGLIDTSVTLTAQVAAEIARGQ